MPLSSIALYICIHICTLLYVYVRACTSIISNYAPVFNRSVKKGAVLSRILVLVVAVMQMLMMVEITTQVMTMM